MTSSDAEDLSQKDRQDLPRQDTGSYFRAQNAATGEGLGEVVNLSPQGMGLRSERETRPGERIGVDVEWTDSSGATKNFALIVECRWCCEGEVAGTFEAGFEVVDMTPVQRMALKIMVANFAQSART